MVRRNPNELRVRVVKRLPAYRDKAQISGKTITITKRTSKTEIEHERGHYALGHNLEKLPHTPTQYAREELDAQLYAHNKTHRTPHIKMQLRAIANDMGYREYHTPAKTVIKDVDKLMARKQTPVSWRSDWSKVRAEIKKVNPF